MKEIDHRYLAPPSWRNTADARLHERALICGASSAILGGTARPIIGQSLHADRLSFTARARSKRRSGRGGVVNSAPAIRRVSMAPHKLERNPFRRFTRMFRDKPAEKGRQSSGAKSAPQARCSRAPRWAVARGRRILLMLLVLTQTAISIWSLTQTFSSPQLNVLHIAIVLVFAVLFSWIAFSFWTNLAGFYWLWRNRNAQAHDVDSTQPPRGRTALVMPICDEEVARCFAGIEAMYRSLAGTGEIAKFEFFILSDSGAERQLEEELAWQQTCRAVGGHGKIFYRRRRVNIKRKSGNVADFLRRWSGYYDYLIVLDADSLMAGETMVQLARRMDASPQVGIVQTVPAIVNRASLFARVQQFANRVFSPLSGASLHFWQANESAYWGHNAIIRVEPFVKHCALAKLPGRAPLGGEILSHDFVEAALMGRAGMEIRIALDIPGSYEDSPPSLLDELKRDRRWCQGNLQHLRLLFADGIKAGHRAIFAMGVMAYVSALLWAVFLILNSFEAASEALSPLSYFSAEPSLFPIWPQWRPQWAIALASTTALMLFLPKLLSLLLIVRSGEARQFGGALPLAVSVLLEMGLSTLLAPLRMWFHSKFVLLTLLGSPIPWHNQQREERGIDWLVALRGLWVSTLVGGGWIAVMYGLHSGALIWLAPVAIPLLFSVPLSVLSSRVSLGRASRRWRLFLVPEEISPPDVLNELGRAMERQECRNFAAGFQSNHSRTKVARNDWRGDNLSWPAESARK
jgi:membrane glycosyltransferase